MLQIQFFVLIFILHLRVALRIDSVYIVCVWITPNGVSTLIFHIFLSFIAVTRTTFLSLLALEVCVKFLASSLGCVFAIACCYKFLNLFFYVFYS